MRKKEEPCRIWINAQREFSDSPGLWGRERGSIGACRCISKCSGEENCPYLKGHMGEEKRRIGIYQGVGNESRTPTERFYNILERHAEIKEAHAD